MDNKDEVCAWRPHTAYVDTWVTGCGHTVESVQGRTPKEIGIKFCVWCGKLLEEKKDA